MPLDQTPNPPQPSTAATAPAPPPPGPSQGYVRMGYLFALVGALLFSTKAIVIKLAYADPTSAVDAVTLLALRMMMALPIYLIIGGLAVRERKRSGQALPPRGPVIKALFVGLLGYWFASYTDFAGLQYISAQFERLILFTYPLFVVLLGAMFFGQKIQVRAVLAILVSYVGLAVIFSEKLGEGGNDVALGAALILGAAIAFALYQLLAKPLIAKIGPALFTCIAMSGAALGALIQFFLTHPVSDLVVGQRVLLLSLMIAIGATVLPSFFLNAALHRISAQANATIGTLSPVMTIALAVAILGEPLTVVDVLGTALVLAGVGWFTLADQAAARRRART
ncbi:MAG: EamA family transporter [Rhizobiales bacterium]|nr:EamA family transporter [Hyphomicrobiales bacterium]